jgi:putative oxidoreductase
MSVLLGILGGSNMGFGSFALVLIGQFIVIIHLMGGIFITIGLHTRLACLTQIPILAGAIVLLKVSGNSIGSAEMIVSAMVLLLLIIFLIEGNGPWSYDKMFKEESKSRA